MLGVPITGRACGEIEFQSKTVQEFFFGLGLIHGCSYVYNSCTGRMSHSRKMLFNQKVNLVLHIVFPEEWEFHLEPKIFETSRKIKFRLLNR